MPRRKRVRSRGLAHLTSVSFDQENRPSRLFQPSKYYLYAVGYRNESATLLWRWHHARLAEGDRRFFRTDQCLYALTRHLHQHPGTERLGYNVRVNAVEVISRSFFWEARFQTGA